MQATLSRARSTCTSCGRKCYRNKMHKVYYRLLHVAAYHCEKCMSTAADNLYRKIEDKTPYLVELFSGSKTVSATAAQSSWKVFTVDIEPDYFPDLQADILTMSVQQIPDSQGVLLLWASVPCTVYSVINCKAHWRRIRYAHRQYYYIPITRAAVQAIRILEKTLYIIRKVKPKYFIIENPRGLLRHMPQMKFIPFRSTVSYHDYGSTVYKPTDLFHNIPGLQLTTLQSSVGRKFEGNITSMANAFERSIVPPALIKAILPQLH